MVAVELSEASLTKHSPFMLQGITALDEPALDFACANCGAALSWRMWLSVRLPRIQRLCPRCKESISTGHHSSPPSKATYQKLQQGTYLAQRWFHVSVQENWVASLPQAEDGQLLIHAGSHLAALSRAEDLLRVHRGAKPLYIHSFHLSDSSAFAPILLEDAEASWQTRLDSPKEMAICGDTSTLALASATHSGAPYYNRYELPGDVSLLFHCKLIALSTMETIVLYSP